MIFQQAGIESIDAYREQARHLIIDIMGLKLFDAGNMNYLPGIPDEPT